MNNIYIAIGLAIVSLLAGYYLGQIWAPYGVVGILAALSFVILYIFMRFKRMQ